MSKKQPTYLIFDVNNSMHRHFHAMGGLKGEDKTGALFGFFRELKALQTRFQTTQCIFCFDSKYSLRAEAFPTYKATRREKRQQWTEEERIAHNCLEDQIAALQDYHLPTLGYYNCFQQTGYEADDMIAKAVRLIEKQDVFGIIVSSDHDLYQLLLGQQIAMWLPHKKQQYDAYDLSAEFLGMLPSQWASVLAIAGCAGDGVVGVKGVGEKTAVKYLRGKLGKKTKAYRTIEMWNKHPSVYLDNLRLVELPYPGTSPINLQPDTFTEKKWRKLCNRLNFKSLIGGF